MRSLLPLALPALLLAAAPLADMPVHRPAEGAKLETSWTIELGAELGEISASVNGETLDPAHMGLPDELSAKGSVEMRWLDHFVSMDGARALELVRTVRALEAKGETSMGQSGSDADSDELVDKPIRFRWNAEEEAYEREWVDAEGKENSLEHMAVDADLRGLLPEGAVEVGQTWEARGPGVLRLLVPLYAIEDIGEGEALDGEEIPPELLEQLEALGEEVAVTCTWRGAHEEGGRTLGRIDLALALDHSLDVDPSAFDEDMEGMEVEPMTLSIASQLNGFVDWDLEGNHMAAVELAGSGTLALDFAMSNAEMGFELEGSADASFELSIRGSTQAE